ncbi:amidohydrolase family protein [Acidothermaceae bacterium B102]|nr:amidohydrolase family protein [Acidothermaceae bacterium B102]
MRWDVHNHVVPESLIPHLRSDFPVSVTGHVVEADRVRFSLTPEFTDPLAKLRQLESVGLEAAIVSLVPALFCYHADPAQAAHLATLVNESLAEFCAAETRRLRWMAHVPLQDPPSIAGVLERAKANGAVGVEVGTSMAGKPLDHPEFDLLWSAASRLGLPVMLHPAYNSPHPGLEDWYLQNAIGNLLETTIAAERIMCAGHLVRYPALRIILLHGGGFVPWQLGRLKHVRRVRQEAQSIPGNPEEWMGRFIFDTLTHDPEVLGMLVKRVGPDQLLMGTDAPFDMASRNPVGDLMSVVDEAIAKVIMEENPALIFDLG